MFKYLKLRKPKSSASSADAAVARLLTTLKNMGMTPRHIVDIGANHGGWSRTALSIFPQAYLSIFEPQQRLAEYLADLERNPNIKIHYKGVGDFNGTAPFTFHDRDDSCSFIYVTEDAQERGFSQSEIEICTLDTIMRNCDFGAADIVKIDAEGLDLQVLDGAGETLSTTEIVLIEASVSNPDYPNSALAVIQKMDCLGFRLFDLTDLNRTPNRNLLWLVEAVFVRKGSAIDVAASTFN
jgi:FkbM family methyltransferase